MIGVVKYSTYKEYCEKNNILFENVECKTLIIVGKTYPKVKCIDDYKLADYCYNVDYHKRLREIFIRCETHYDEKKFFVDINPINEKVAGYLAGLGFIGKNNLLINKKYGSYFNIGVLLSEHEFDCYDKISEEDIICDACNQCILHCKNEALKTGFNKYLCKSFLTQYKNECSFNYMFNDLIVGCDSCATCCPYNYNVEKFEIYEKTVYDKINLEYLSNSSNRQFKKDFGNTTIGFINKNILLKNIFLLQENKKK